MFDTQDWADSVATKQVITLFEVDNMLRRLVGRRPSSYDKQRFGV